MALLLGGVIERLLLVLATLGALFDMHTGVAPHYSPGLMERVARKRHLPPAACMVSSPRYEVGTWVFVYGAAMDRLEYCQVVDVSQPYHRADHLRKRYEVEMSYDVALRLCGSTKTGPKGCAVTVVRVRR